MLDLYATNILRLNALYMRLGWSSAESAIKAMMGGIAEGDPPYQGLVLEYPLLPDGMPDRSQSPRWFPVYTWEDWLKLPIRPWDEFIQTSKYRIRVPTVVVCPHMSEVVIKEQRVTPSAIRERDKDTCQYSGRKLVRKEMSLDHIIPRSKGGRDAWGNLVLCHKDINSRKGDRFNHQAGLKLIRQPPVPKSIPLSATVKGHRHPDHKWF